MTHARRIGMLVVGGLLLAAAAAAAAVLWWLGRPSLPDGLAHGNGRIEAEEVDVSTKYAGRVEAVFADEGDLVQPGQVLARMETAELDASLREARAGTRAARQSRQVAESVIAQRESECDLAESELRRSETLFEKHIEPKSRLDVKRSQWRTALAACDAAQAQLLDADARIEAAEATVERIQTQIDDASLVSPVRGRVLYHLAKVGEVLPAGGRVLTLIDLGSLYMEIFLSSEQATRASLGAEARIVLDAAPEYVFPAAVSFVSPEAQFTPKQVETLTERSKLMFRVKLRVSPELAEPYLELAKAGIRGLAYVQLGPDPPPWPTDLEVRLPPGAR